MTKIFSFTAENSYHLFRAPMITTARLKWQKYFLEDSEPVFGANPEGNLRPRVQEVQNMEERCFFFLKLFFNTTSHWLPC